MNEFYFTLQSDTPSSTTTKPNSTTNFTVKADPIIEFEHHQYEVALVDFWLEGGHEIELGKLNIKFRDGQSSTIDLKCKDGESFKSIFEFVNRHLREAQIKHEYLKRYEMKDSRIKYIPQDREFYDAYVLHDIGLDPMCEIVYDESKGTVLHKFPVDIKLHYVGAIEAIMGNGAFDLNHNNEVRVKESRMHSLKVCHVVCDLVPNQYINNTQQQVLRTISTFQKDFIQNPHYVQLPNPFIDQITIGLRENIDKELNFNQGRFTALLHFRQKK